MHRSLAAVLVAASLLVAGCKSDSEKLIELRTDLRSEIDELYGRYGGGSLARDAKADAEKEGAPSEGKSTAARLFGELDRSWFEGYCLAHGRGERPFNLSGRLEEFMKDPAHQEACRRAAQLETRIRELEAKAGTAR